MHRPKTCNDSSNQETQRKTRTPKPCPVCGKSEEMRGDTPAAVGHKHPEAHGGSGHLDEKGKGKERSADLARVSHLHTSTLRTAAKDATHRPKTCNESRDAAQNEDSQTYPVRGRGEEMQGDMRTVQGGNHSEADSTHLRTRKGQRDKRKTTARGVAGGGRRSFSSGCNAPVPANARAPAIAPCSS